MTNRQPALPELDPVIHPQARLQVMTVLCSLSIDEKIDFTTLQQTLGLSAGNLSTHLGKLEEAGYVKIAKSFRGRRPVTWLEATDKGRAAFDAYLENLRAYFAAQGRD